MKNTPKTRAGWNTWLRKAIFAGHKQIGNIAKQDRLFPGIVHSASLPLTTNDDGEWSNPDITADYVRRYCELNHLTQG